MSGLCHSVVDWAILCRGLRRSRLRAPLHIGLCDWAAPTGDPHSALSSMLRSAPSGSAPPSTGDGYSERDANVNERCRRKTTRDDGPTAVHRLLTARVEPPAAGAPDYSSSGSTPETAAYESA